MTAHVGKVAQPPRRECERILASPVLARLLHLHVQRVFPLDDAETPVVLWLFQANLQPNWFEKRISKSDIRQPRFFQIHSQCQMIELRTFSPVLARHASGKQCHLESEVAEQGCEGAIQFIAE